MTKEQLRDACFAYENEHGMEAFCNAMADIMAERMTLKVPSHVCVALLDCWSETLMAHHFLTARRNVRSAARFVSRERREWIMLFGSLYWRWFRYHSGLHLRIVSSETR